MGSLFHQVTVAIATVVSSAAFLFSGGHVEVAHAPAYALAQVQTAAVMAAVDRIGGVAATPQTYTVQSGDTLSQIAESLGVSQAALVSQNNLSASSVIRPGDTLSVPAHESANVTVANSSTTNIVERPIVQDIVVAAPRVSTTSYVSESELNAALNSLRTQLFNALPSYSFSGPAATTPVSTAAFSSSQRINALSGVTISNSTIDTASIPDLSGSYLPSGSATSTNFAITSLAAPAGAFLAADPNGTIIATTSPSSGSGAAFAWSIADYGVSTSTTVGFNTGLLSLASSTIGDGTQAGGLTISGGATTTGQAYFAGNVGIGTTSPSSLLNLYSSQAAPLTIERSAAATAGIQYKNTAGSVYAGLSATNHFGIGPNVDLNSSPYLSIDTSGNVGIGTSGPVGALQVVGSVYSNAARTNSIFNGGGTWANTANFVGSGALWAIRTATNYSYNLDMYNSGGSPLTAMTVLQNGNVGIGTTTPAAALEIYNTSTADLLLSTTQASSSLRLRAWWDGAGHGVNFDPQGDNGNFYFGRDNTLSKFVVQSGNVGIGNTSPAYVLDVTGNGHFTSLVDADHFVATSSSNASFFNGGLLSLASSTIGNGTQSGGLTVSGGATTTGRAYFAGNVGVGTTSPGFVFGASGSFGVYGPVLITGGNKGSVSYAVGDTGDAISVVGGTGQTATVVGRGGNGGAVSVIAGPGGTGTSNATGGYGGNLYLAGGAAGTGFTDGTGGNVFIGTDSAGVARGNVAVGTSTVSAKFSIQANLGDTNSLLFAVGSSTTGAENSLFDITNTGKVGIGVSDPVAKLQLGTLSFGGAATHHGDILLGVEGVDGPATTGGIEFQTSAAGSGYGMKIYPNATGGNLSGGYLGFATRYSSAAWTERMVIDNQSGNIQIGTTTLLTTNAKLAVAAGASTLYAVYGISANSGGYNASFTNSATGNGCTLPAGSTAWSCSSDERLKTDITPIGGADALTTLSKLSGVTFHWKSLPDGPLQVGLLAQAVQAVYPEAVSTSTTGYLSLQYDALVGPIISAIGELNVRIASLSDAIDKLASSITTAVVTATTGHFTNELCVGDTCVTPEQFKAMVAATASSQSSETTGPSSETDGPPVIEVNGNNPAYVSVGVTYNDLGARITGPTDTDKNLGVHTYVGSSPIEQVVIDTSTSTTYHILYVATNAYGTATSTRTVIVEETTETGTTDSTTTPVAAGTSPATSTNATSLDTSATTTDPTGQATTTDATVTPDTIGETDTSDATG